MGHNILFDDAGQ